jgi:hypothetical protein
MQFICSLELLHFYIWRRSKNPHRTESYGTSGKYRPICLLQGSVFFYSSCTFTFHDVTLLYPPSWMPTPLHTVSLNNNIFKCRIFRCSLWVNYTLVMSETIPSSETSVLTRATRRNIPEDGAVVLLLLTIQQLLNYCCCCCCCSCCCCWLWWWW